MNRFEIGETDFLLDRCPFRILSGALHYFRVHPGQWADRIRAARLMGLNTIETYVAWNEHAPVRGAFDLSGRLDLGAFLDAVHREGMHAIVRPGPYICAEFDNGGLPAWLTSIPGIDLRCTDAVYLAAVEEYITEVAAVVRPRQIDHGGPVILMQVENEYGAYGNDTAYLHDLVRMYRRDGLTVPLTTIDQPIDAMLAAGGLPEIHKTGSFGSRSAERLATLRAHQPTGPLMCAEFWDGWFDSWGGIHHTTSTEAAAAELDALLAAGASVNIYMFHGGTNFGLTNGANHKGRYLPIATSYDYDAPLDEAGNPTEKYWAFRDVIARYASVPAERPPTPQFAPALDVTLTSGAPLSDVVHSLGETVASEKPLSFDAIGHARGLGVYSVDIDGRSGALLEVGEIRDRAWLAVDGAPAGILDRGQHERSARLPAGRRLELLVEDQGRVNYGPRLGESKGLVGPVLLDGEEIRGWTVRPLAIELLPTLDLPDLDDARGQGPVVARGTFELRESTDLFLDTSGLGKGFAWVNGFALGRYWRRGPQQTLYIPAPATTAGVNTVTVLELEVLAEPALRFVAEPQLGPTEE